MNKPVDNDARTFLTAALNTCNRDNLRTSALADLAAIRVSNANSLLAQDIATVWHYATAQLSLEMRAPCIRAANNNAVLARVAVAVTKEEAAPKPETINAIRHRMGLPRATNG